MQDWHNQSTPQIITELCGFVTILAGTFLLHATKDMGDATAALSEYTMNNFAPSLWLPNCRGVAMDACSELSLVDFHCYDGP